MGLSFHDQNSLLKASAESLNFVPANDPNPILETETAESTSIVDWQKRRNDDIDTQVAHDPDTRMAEMNL